MTDKTHDVKHPGLEVLVQEAIKHGATSSAIISSDEIQVTEKLAALCNGEYRCPYYGLAAGCPPHVEGPAEFKKWQANSEFSITVKIEIPMSVMFSSERNEVMRLLHQVVSAVVVKAAESGLTHSRGFAGGSCKELFCNTHKGCSVLEENSPCRHAGVARPSMSGFGIDVSLLMKSSGWSGERAENYPVKDQDEMSWVAGLILLA